ncbi:MAG TPA: hypothetical protein PKC23_11675, partial [Candidatus Desulfobacillus sp.]|nr:hypothetical protein [Candidatus Desulfobacillus sp.]
MTDRILLPLLMALLCGLPQAAWAQGAASSPGDKDDDLNAPVVGKATPTLPTKEQRQQYREQKEAAYARMKRYGINREDIDAL